MIKKIINENFLYISTIINNIERDSLNNDDKEKLYQMYFVYYEKIQKIKLFVTKCPFESIIDRINRWNIKNIKKYKKNYIFL